MKIMDDRFKHVKRLIKSVTIKRAECPYLKNSNYCKFGKTECNEVESLNEDDDGPLYKTSHFNGDGPFCLQIMFSLGTMERVVLLNKLFYSGKCTLQELREFYGNKSKEIGRRDQTG